MAVTHNDNPTPQGRSAAATMAACLRGVAAACPDSAAVYRAFGGMAAFMTAAEEASRRPAPAQAPVSVHRHLPDAAQKAFARDCVRGWTTARRPGLPQLAAALLREKDIDPDNLPPVHDLPPQGRAIVRAILLTAARAEINEAGRGNKYHNPVHTAHVAVMAGYLADLNDQLVEGYGRFATFTERDKLLVLLAAFAHDIDHPGKPNPPGDPYRNERAALAVVKPLMAAAGMAAHDIARVETMILATSPDGPHAAMKKVARAHAHRERISAADVAAHPEMAVLADDRELAQMAAILGDADLFASAGAGMEGSRIMGHRLTGELRRAGMNVDFTTPQARESFMRNVVGADGFASQAATAAFTACFRALLADNEKLLKSAAAPRP